MTQLLHTVGVVDDDVSVRSALRRLFRTAAFNVVLFETAEEYLANPNRDETDCLIIDVCLPGMGGLELLEITQQNGGKPALIITGNVNEDIRQRALAAGAIGFFSKPFDNHALLSVVCKVFGTSVGGPTIPKSSSQANET